MSGKRSPSCGSYQWINGICKSCGFAPSANGAGFFTPRFELGKADIFKLAEGLKAKKEQERRQAILKLSQCPYCHEHSLFYNSKEDCFECMNMKTPCLKYKYIIKPNTDEYKRVFESIEKRQ